MNDRRLNVRLTGSAYDELAELAQNQGKTMTELVRDALTLEKWFYETRRKGGRVLVQHPEEDEPKQVVLAR